MTKKHKLLSIVISKCLIVFLAVCIIIVGLNGLVILSTRDKVTSPAKADTADCILVLGCGLHDDGTPGRMLTRRLDTAIELYKLGKAPKLLMSGDHGRNNYDEVNAMKRYAVEHGIPPEDVFMDHAGFCTYDSAVRAKQIFGCESVLIVTQPYHLYRSIWNAEKQGMKAQGVPAEMYNYGRRYTAWLYIREAFARVKDTFVSILRLPASVMGDPIDIHGNGAASDDASTSQWLMEMQPAQ